MVMGKTGFEGPKLPKALLEQLGSVGERTLKVRNRKERCQNSIHKSHQRKNDRVQKHVTKPKDVEQPKSILKSSKQIKPQYDSGDEEEEEAEAEEDEVGDTDGAFRISRQQAKAGMDSADAQIAELERKLGMRGRKRGRVEDKDLDWLVVGSDSEGEITAFNSGRTEKEAPPSSEADELSEGDFEGFDEDESEAAEPPAKKRRENPYVAPVTQGDQNPVAKYVPLSLGKPTTGEQEDLKQLRRQIQGQLNRLSNENMLSILQAVERIYSENPRQHVTSCLIELLMDLIINPSSLSETFVILHGAFCAAVYKVIGADFGAQLLERIVAEFAKWHLVEGEGKQLLNLVGFLSSLYSFQVVGSALVFDIMRLLLDELTETNTVLLLRLIQISGPQLRKDDPLALKTVIRLLQRNVDKAGLDNLPLRTRFMIETIHKLKDNRLKANAAGIAALVSETTTRFRKILGTLTSSRSSLRAREALNITMEDINSADKKGKWWLVGASYHDPSKMANGTVSAHEPSPNIEDDEDETPTSLPQEDDLSSLYRLAREQGMNTPVRVSIFVALVSSVNYKDAHTKLLKLNLKAKQSLEIPQVMLFCVRTENPYNPFYALVARQLCNQNRFARAFRFGLGWLVQKLQSKEGEEGEEDGEVFDLEKVMALAQFYGSLIAYEAMRVTVLKNVDFERVKGGKMGTFVELCLTRLLTKVGAKDVGRVFQNARAAPRMVSGLQTYLTRKVAKAGLGVGEKEKRRIKKQCESAVEALEALGDVDEGAPDDDSD